MAKVSERYQKLVLDDLKNYSSLGKPVKASIIERLLVRRLPVKQIHPNPSDEFCDPAIGPNGEIVNKYIAALRVDPPKMEIFEDKPVVQKLNTGGYMLLNGHHRWYAAANIGFKKIPVQLVNMIHDDEILQKMKESKRTMCASFDMDEVLMENKGRIPTVRRNAGVLIRSLQEIGFDVWGYTGKFWSDKQIKHLFAGQKANFDGVINGMGARKTKHVLRRAFKEQYGFSLHIDGESVVWVNTRTGEYDSCPISQDGDWANNAFSVVRGLEQLKAALK